MKNIIYKLTAIILTLCFMMSLCGCSEKGGVLRLVKDASLSDSSYNLGDSMGDYTVTDVNGETYIFSDILKEKKAIVLNFWFINCGPCQMEFPYLQKAADAFGDDVAVIAINPTTDKENNIKKYAAQNELSIPLIKGEEAWITAFGLRGFPTTVVIDRYGCVAFSHTGAVTEDGVFEKIFEFFAADDYKQTIVKSINDIK